MILSRNVGTVGLASVPIIFIPAGCTTKLGFSKSSLSNPSSNPNPQPKLNYSEGICEINEELLSTALFTINQVPHPQHIHPLAQTGASPTYSAPRHGEYILT